MQTTLAEAFQGKSAEPQSKKADKETSNAVGASASDTDGNKENEQLREVPEISGKRRRQQPTRGRPQKHRRRRISQKENSSAADGTSGNESFAVRSTSMLDVMLYFSFARKNSESVLHCINVQISSQPPFATPHILGGT